MLAVRWSKRAASECDAAGAAVVSREVVRPISRPDPWKRTLGGPGGPRYPIGGDEYSVSM